MTREIRSCNVCVVGGAGFLGSHLVDYLVEHRHCDVLVIDSLVAGRREFVHPKATLSVTDITISESELRRLFEYYKTDYVFNYAAWPYVPDSYARPLQVFNINCFGAIKVINAAQEAGVEAILQVSSAELYGEGGHSKHCDEGAPVIPRSSYGSSKAAVDYFCQAAWRERQTPVIALRQFNCVGERETHPYVVPEIISQLYSSGRKPGTIRLGNNSARDFMYAGDAVAIAVQLLERGDFGEVYNLGSEEAVKIYDLAQLIGGVVGAGRVVVEEDAARKRAWEIWHLQSDNTKIRQACLKWGSDAARWELTPLKEALARTVRYYESNGKHWCWENPNRTW